MDMKNMPVDTKKENENILVDEMRDSRDGWNKKNFGHVDVWIDPEVRKDGFGDKSTRKVWTGKKNKPWQYKYGDGVDVNKMAFWERRKYYWYRGWIYRWYWHTCDTVKWFCGCRRVVWMDFNEPEPEEEERLDQLKQRQDHSKQLPVTCCDYILWYKAGFDDNMRV